MWKDLPYKGTIYFSLILNLILIVVVTITFFLKIIPPAVPLFYGLPVGVEQLVPAIDILIAPVVGILLIIINIFLSNFTGDLFLKKALVITSVFTSLLLAITITKVILLVGFF